MREILFRAKNKVDSEWSIGSLAHDTKYGNCFIELCVHQGICEEVIPETVGQYTGLTDKNGVKIFEGDIIEGDLNDDLELGAKWRSEIVWGKFGWMCKDRQTLPMDEYDIREGEVIGNIYDNPELMEVIK